MSTEAARPGHYLMLVDKRTAAFHEYERLVEIARSIDPRTLLVILLGG
jgi:hypothetical protein